MRKRFWFISSHAARRSRVLVALALPTLLVGVAPAGAALPTDGSVPRVTAFNLAQGKEILPGQSVGALVLGTFVPPQIPGTTADVTFDDPTLSFEITVWDEEKIVGVLSTTAATSLGNKDVTVVQKIQGEDATSTKEDLFHIGLTPTVTTVSPSSIIIDAGPAVTVTGTKFEGLPGEQLPKVRLERSGENPIEAIASTVSADRAQLTVTFPVSEDVKLLSWNLRIENRGSQQKSASPGFAVNLNGENPEITTVSVSAPTPAFQDPNSTTPLAWHVGQGQSFSVQVTGDNFFPELTNSMITIGTGMTVSNLVRVDSEHLTFTLGVADTATPGAYPLEVKNKDNRTGTLANAFVVMPKPVIPDTQLMPVAQGVRYHAMTLEGSGFDQKMVVTFEDDAGAPAADLSIEPGSQWVKPDGTAVVFQLHASEGTDVGQQQQLRIRLTNPGGGTDVCELVDGRAGCVLVTPGPIVKDVSPPQVRAGGSADLVITGRQFQYHRLMEGQGISVGFPNVLFSNENVRVQGVTYGANVPTDGSTDTQLLIVSIRVDPMPTYVGPVDVIVRNPDGGRGTKVGGLTITP